MRHRLAVLLALLVLPCIATGVATAPSGPRSLAQTLGPGAQSQQATNPPPRFATGMAYDVAHQQIVLFGGFGLVGEPPARALNDTWTWGGSAWIQQNPSASPPPLGQGQSMVYDAALEKAVLLSKAEHAPNTDIWTWDGSAWMRQDQDAAKALPLRILPSMAYDAARGTVVVFGGLDFNSFTFSTDTWTWDGNTWSRHNPATSPPPRDFAAMAYDAARQQVVLSGGFCSASFAGCSSEQSDVPFNDTWTWDGNTWLQQQPATSPSARIGASMTYDAARQQIVLFGGCCGDSDERPDFYFNDTWTWDGSTWTNATAP